MVNLFEQYVIVNNSGQANVQADGGIMALRVTGVYVVPATGKLAYDTSLAELNLLPSGTLNNGSEVVSAEVNNSSNKYINFIIQLNVAHSAAAAADGSFDIYRSSGDSTGELPTDKNGYVSAESNKLEFVGSLFWLTGGTNDDYQLSNAFII